MADQFRIDLTDEAKAALARLKKRDVNRARKVASTLKKLREHGPSYPSLNSHKIDSIAGPHGQTWESYIENHTPDAWRIFWCYGPKAGVITVFLIRNHL